MPWPQQGIVKGDARSLSIAAASVIAKTTRDALMVEAEGRFPGYGFARHKGYGSPEHLEALRRLGPCELHRRSFAPVREALGIAPAQGELFEGAARPARGLKRRPGPAAGQRRGGGRIDSPRGTR